MSYQSVKIDLSKKIVKKEYASHNLAQRYYLLYSEFHQHVIPVSVQGKFLIYNYAEGSEFKAFLLHPNNALTKKAVIYIAKALAQNHQNYTLARRVYDEICKKRQIVQNCSFTPSGYYFGNIHGDLNTKNIIVNNKGEILFIDRLCKDGDIMYDFTFLMSILCLYVKTKNKNYLELVDIFWENYNIPLESKNDFFTSFRNNFVNYGHLVAQDTIHHKSFPEWKYGHIISEELVQHPSFSEYLISLNSK